MLNICLLIDDVRESDGEVWHEDKSQLIHHKPRLESPYNDRHKLHLQTPFEKLSPRQYNNHNKQPPRSHHKDDLPGTLLERESRRTQR
jgi:hypothetical protein